MRDRALMEKFGCSWHELKYEIPEETLEVWEAVMIGEQHVAMGRARQAAAT